MRSSKRFANFILGELDGRGRAMVMVYFLLEQNLIFRERLKSFFPLMCDVPDAVILVPLFHITLADWIGITGLSSIPCGPSREDFITLLL